MSEDKTYGPKELAADLRELLANQPKDRTELDDWYARTHALWTRLTQAEPRFKVPSRIWRWLNDADARLESPWYDKMCTRMLMDALEELERSD